ncbi:hypothetical protein [Longimicrobium sp.]|uniref:hypothetical protein n=1 Tax=Longimicrobium sp. TaxID=2029185 RepID=UPI003B3A411E
MAITHPQPYRALILLLFLCSLATALIPAPAMAQQQPVQIATSLKNDTSPAISQLVAELLPKDTTEQTVRRPRLNPLRVGRRPIHRDPVVQDEEGPRSPLMVTRNFIGLGEEFAGPHGVFSLELAPPDPTGAAGLTQYVQATNSALAIFEKNFGTPVYGPVPLRSVWKGFGTACEHYNDGDPIVEYDQMEHRWIISQFQVSADYYSQCVAVSETSDATGRYYRYEFAAPAMNDYPKLGIWPDAYYVSYNMYYGPPDGARVCAWERARMLRGEPAREICAQLSDRVWSLLPSDLDGSTLPPIGSPNYVLGLQNFGSLQMWHFKVDWNTPSASLFGLGESHRPNRTIAVAPFRDACASQACIPQKDTPEVLESVGERLMYRLAYRRFQSHEALVVTHSVEGETAPSALRWYEIRNPGGTPQVHQQGTYSPDATSRWMGSVAMDAAGNILIGYNASGTGMYPGLRVAGRTPRDPVNVLGTETVVVEGTGAQVRNSRWGDYSEMSIDPVDDCTFWYTGSYVGTTGKIGWKTQVAAFRFPDCVSTDPEAAPEPPANEAGVTNPVPEQEIWGGEGIRLIVRETEIDVILPCAHGKINGHLPGSGHFELPGTYVAERGGPVRVDSSPRPVAAAYTGEHDGASMSLCIRVPPDTVLGAYQLTRNQMTRIARCLSA